MSDQGLTTESAPPHGAIGAETPAVSVVGSVGADSAPVSTDPLGDLPVDRAVFDRGYVESIRKEAQRYRGEAQRAGEYEAVFGVYEPQDREVWFNLARTWNENPAQAAQIMQQIANNVLGDQMQSSMDGGNATQEPPPVLDDNGEELTPERVQQMIEEGFKTREQRAAEQKAIDDVMGEVRNHGFDPNSAEGFMVLWRANHETNGDIRAAAESVKAYRQSIIDDYVQGRSSGRIAMTTPAGVQATPNAEPIKNLDDARRATDAFLRERRGA